MPDKPDYSTGHGSVRTVLEQPDAPDGCPWLVCELQPVAGMPTYVVLSSHRRRIDALAELVVPELRPLLRALRAALPWLDRDRNGIVHYVQRLAQALAAEGCCVMPITPVR